MCDFFNCCGQPEITSDLHLSTYNTHEMNSPRGSMSSDVSSFDPEAPSVDQLNTSAGCWPQHLMCSNRNWQALGGVSIVSVVLFYLAVLSGLTKEPFAGLVFLMLTGTVLVGGGGGICIRAACCDNEEPSEEPSKKSSNISSSFSGLFSGLPPDNLSDEETGQGSVDYVPTNGTV